MDGPSHYREAERLLHFAVETHEGQPADTNIARAQVHATLALAMAVAYKPGGEGGINDQAWKEWVAAAEAKHEPADVPGQVEPALAAPVRIDSLFGQVQTEDIDVSHPDWNNGKPVLLTELHCRFDGRVDVTYSVPETRAYLSATVAADTLVTPYGGAA